MKIERITGSIYDHPNLYDVLFSDGSRREIAFLLEMLRRYGGAPKNGSFFEPACGTGRLLWRLGKLGHAVTGLDLNPKAAAFCNRRLRRHGLAETTAVGDMTNFRSADLGGRDDFDMAFNLVSSFLHLTAEEDARNHLDAVADILKPDGCYLLGFHLLPGGEAFCAQENWSVRHGSLSLRSRLQRIDLDRRKRLETVEFRIEATTPRKRYEVVDRFPLRTYSLRQFRNLLEKSARFEVICAYDFSLDRPIRPDSRTEDVVFVLRRTER